MKPIFAIYVFTQAIFVFKRNIHFWACKYLFSNLTCDTHGKGFYKVILTKKFDPPPPVVKVFLMYCQGKCL